jgi:sodium transport system permease protein
MFILPVVLYPLLLLGLSQILVHQKLSIKKTTTSIALSGAPEDLAIHLQTQSRGHSFQTLDIPNPRQALAEGTVSIWISWQEGDDPPPQLTIHYSGTREDSRLAQKQVVSLVKEYRRQKVVHRLQNELGTDESLLRPFQIARQNIESSERQAGFMLGRVLSLLLVLMSVFFPFYPAIDSAAGEKERGTLETLLVSPVKRREIVTGKYASIFTIAMVGSLLNLASMGLTFTHFTHLVNVMKQEAQNSAILESSPDPTTSSEKTTPVEDGIVEEYMQIRLDLTPAILLQILLILTPLCGLLSAVSLALSTYARSYKEAQYYLTPLSLAVLPLALIGLIPGAELDGFNALIPITGPVLLFQSLFLGSAPPLFFGLVLGSTIFYGALSLHITRKLFEDEEILFREGTLWTWRFWQYSPHRGKAPGPSQALLLLGMAFLSLWYVGQPLQLHHLAWGIAFSQIVLFLGGTLAICHLYRFPIKKTLSLYRPRAIHLLGSLLLGIGGFLIGRQVLHGQILLFPQMPEMMHQMGSDFSILFEQVPPFGVLILLTIVPAICEETVFRGFILNSLVDKNRRPLAALFLSAATFAFLHLSLIRFPFTFTLGVFLGLGVLLSGSLYVGIVAHFISNVLALASPHLPIDSLDNPNLSLPTWLLFLAVILILVSTFLLKSDKRPDPTDPSCPKLT